MVIPMVSPIFFVLVIVVFLFPGNDPAEKAVTLVKNACGEEKDVRRTRNIAVPKGQAPEAINRDRLAVAVFELAVERGAFQSIVFPIFFVIALVVGMNIQPKAIDAPVAEVAHQQVAGEFSEMIGSESQAPG